MTGAPDDRWAQFYTRHAPDVYAVLRKVMRNDEDAEDVLQDVFLQAWKQADRFDASRGTVKAWLMTIARSRAIDRLRSRPRWHGRLRDDDTVPGNGADPLAGALAGERRGALRGALRRLPAAQRSLLSLAYDEDLSHSRIAAVLAMPLGTVKTRIRKSLVQLRTARGSECPAVDDAQDDDVADRPFTVGVGCPTKPAAWDMFDIDNSLRARLQRLQLVVVDDDFETLRLLSAVFGRFDVRASMHSTARSGMAAIQTAVPDVLLADLDMPGEDGYSLIAQARVTARHAGRALPVVAFTGRDTEQERSRTSLAGFDAYLTKPLHPLALLSAVARLGERRAV